MNNYTFSTLNDKEFEEISKDLLNAKYNLGLQSFRSGRDSGIDIRYSSSINNNSIVVQVKHFLKSGYSLLKTRLANDEYDKIVKLNPDRYILVTSIDLTANQKDELKEVLAPFVKTSNDIIAQNDLNDYLKDFDHIEKQYHKLWLSSVSILQTVLQNAIEGRTKYFLNQLEQKIKYYVITHKIDDANQILKSEKILLVTGQPGIGKTSLAEILLFQRAKDSFKIYKVENIKDAEDVISLDNTEAQIFYFDDFLGANYMEIINSHKTETQLTSFVERIRNTPNKYLILTTRTIVLNYATERYEKISHSSLGNRKFELKLNDYSKYEKALILYNHFYHKGVDDKFYDVILKEKFYKTIINHDNYTPRIIEFITDYSKIKNFDQDEYYQFVINNLKNPKEIWRYSFANQIEYLDRCMLLTLFSFGNEIEESLLQSAFESRLEYEKVQHNQIIKTNQFSLSISILQNGFISSILYNYNESHQRRYKFINPSLTDFLINYVAESLSERKSILNSIISIEQLKRFKPKESIIPLEKELQLVILNKISNQEFTCFSNCDIITYSEILLTLTDFCKDVNTDKLVHLYLTKIDLNADWNFTIFHHIKITLEGIEDSPCSYDFIKNNFIKIIEKLMSCIDEVRYIEDIQLLFEKFEVSFDEYNTSERGKENIEKMVEKIMSYTEAELTDNIKDEALSMTDIEGIYDELNEVKQILFESLILESEVKKRLVYTIDKAYWEEIIEDNIIKNEMREFEQYDYDNSMNDKQFGIESEESQIERLFE